MPTVFRDARAFFEALRDMAEDLRQALVELDEGGRRRLVSQALAESDMVYGIWPDDGEPGGIGVQIIKGEDLMPPLVGFETDHEVIVAAILCAGLEQAIAARDAWGRARHSDENGTAISTATSVGG